jgi:L-glyceraldehyde reductase
LLIRFCLFSCQPVKEIAATLSKQSGETVDPAQVLIAWGAVGGISVIPKSSVQHFSFLNSGLLPRGKIKVPYFCFTEPIYFRVTPSRIDSNFKQVKLSEEDFNKITELGKKKTVRYNVPVTYEPKW